MELVNAIRSDKPIGPPSQVNEDALGDFDDDIPFNLVQTEDVLLGVGRERSVY